MRLNSACLMLLFLIERLYISIVVVVAKALSSEATEDIAAEKITAINKPTTPIGI